MALTSGTRLGPYAIVSPIGTGGIIRQDGDKDIVLTSVGADSTPVALLDSQFNDTGKTLAFNHEHPKTSFDIFVLELGSERSEPRPFLATELNESAAMFSPDGHRFLTIQESDEELRRTEIHVVLNWIEALERLVPSDP